MAINPAWQELNERLDRTRIVIVGGTDWTEMMVALYNAAVACLAIAAFDYADYIVGVMEAEADALFRNDPNASEVAARQTEYKFGKPFSGDNLVEPRLKNW